MGNSGISARGGQFNVVVVQKDKKWAHVNAKGMRKKQERLAKAKLVRSFSVICLISSKKQVDDTALAHKQGSWYVYIPGSRASSLGNDSRAQPLPPSIQANTQKHIRWATLVDPVPSTCITIIKCSQNASQERTA